MWISILAWPMNVCSNRYITARPSRYEVQCVRRKPHVGSATGNGIGRFVRIEQDLARLTHVANISRLVKDAEGTYFWQLSKSTTYLQIRYDHDEDRSDEFLHRSTVVRGKKESLRRSSGSKNPPIAIFMNLRR